MNTTKGLGQIVVVPSSRLVYRLFARCDNWCE